MIISDIVAGNDVEIERTLTTIPSGTVLSQAWFTVKKKYTDADVDAIISKLITTVNQSGIGFIEDAGAGDGIAKIHFYLTPLDTVKLIAYSQYPYDIKIKLDNSMLFTPESGLIVASPAVKQGST